MKCDDDDCLPPLLSEVADALAAAIAREAETTRRLGRAVVMLYDDLSDHLPDDVLATVTECRAALAAQERVPHVIEEGSRQHVVWYDSKGTHCSEPRCEMNAEDAVQEEPHD
jgi:hypothetical protein